MAQKYSDLWRTSRDYFFITFGMALYAFGFCGFILPEKVVIGGLAGIGTIVYLTTGIPVAITQYACNLILLALAYKLVGKKFVLGTIFGATMISVFVGIFQPLLEHGFTQEPFMNIVVGALLAGLGVGIAFTHNGSSGEEWSAPSMQALRSPTTSSMNREAYPFIPATTGPTTR